MDKKAEIILSHFRKKIDNDNFDEYDLLGFLIFIRSYLPKKGFEYIRDIADLIAHRERNRGFVMDVIKAGNESKYAINRETNGVEGYHGIEDNAKWNDEWESLFRQYNFIYSNQKQLDITLCVCSLVQKTQYIIPTITGSIELFIGCNGDIYVATTEENSRAPTVIFAKFGSYELNELFKKSNFYGLHDAMIPLPDVVETYRRAGKLHLRTITGTEII